MAQVSLAAAATLIEPTARNTAPAVLAAALWLAERDPEALMIVSPADHVIPDAAGFQRAIAAARDAAEAGGIVTFGVMPDRPETGYGYLELAGGSDATAQVVQRLERFVEKPDTERAREMVSSGRFLWNAGIFLFQAKTIIAAFGKHAPEMLSLVIEALQKAKPDLAFKRLSPDAWAGVESISIDYAIMEKEPALQVMPWHGAWSDLGSWQAVWQESGPGEHGNVVSSHATAIGC